MMTLLLALFTIPPARAFLIDAGPLRDRPVVNRCVAALLDAGGREGEDVSSKIRKLFLGPIPLEEVTGREVSEGLLSEAGGSHEVLPRRWFKFFNPFAASMRDQRLLRLAVDLADARVPKTVRVYRGPAEIEGFLARQSATATALDEKIRPLLRSNFRVRKTMASALRVSVLGGLGAWIATAGGWPVVGAVVAATGGLDAARLVIRAKYAVAKLLAPRGREPADPRSRRLEKGLGQLPGPRRVYFGITSYVPHEFMPALARARTLDDVTEAELARLADVRHYPPRAGLVLDDYASKLSLDYLYLPGPTPEEAELVVITRLGLPRSR